LISNAIKFTDEGSVSVALALENDHVRVKVRDTGAGIDPAALASIFNRFVQKSSARGRSAGVGLGLAIAKGWTEAHGGKIWAESEGLGRGATFCVELPLRMAPV
jgi:two-component system CheB/CheR fusion protein